jgi:HK97 family phage major capsid protein
MLTKEVYIEKRNNLLSEAEEMIENDDIEGYEAKENEIKELDEKFEKVAKAQANMNALKDKEPKKNNFIVDDKIDNKGDEDSKNDDKFASVEYRKAFMNFAKTGSMEEIPEKFQNVDQVTTTSDAGAVIPTTIMEEVIDKMEEYGQIFSRVRKTNIKGGVQVPINSLKPTAQWIGEETTSDRQKADMSDKITFTYFGLECRISVSLLADVTTLSVFENTLTELIVEAMIKAMDKAIISGSGAGQPLGITQDDRVPTENEITLSSTDFAEWEGWKKKVFAKIPLAYRAGGSFIMAAGTFEGYIDGMTDANGQPIGRTNYGITNGVQERFGGREVLLVEDDVISPYEAAATGDVVAVFCKLSDYTINSNMQMTMYRWTDHDNNEKVDKALLIADGKILDPNGVIIVKKGA